MSQAADERVTVTTTEVVCMGETTLGHETVRCTVTHQPEEPHRNQAFGCWPPCPNCQGLDEHSQQCPTPDLLGRVDTWADVTWRTGEKPRVRCGRRARRW